MTSAPYTSLIGEADLLLCKKVANVMGNSSAAAKALEKYDELKAQNKNPRLVALKNVWRVEHGQ